MSRDEEEEYLWKTLSDVSGRIFHTSGRGGKGSVKFTYTIKGGEMFINKKDESITRSSVIMAYRKVKEMGIVNGPKSVGTIGAGYLYPIFIEMQICRAE